MIKPITFVCLALLFFINVGTSQTTDTAKQPDLIQAELNAYWAEVSRSVKAVSYTHLTLPTKA